MTRHVRRMETGERLFAEGLAGLPTTQGLISAVACYSRWCLANGLDPVPAGPDAPTGEQMLLRYLHAEHGLKIEATARTQATFIAQYLMAHGLPDPRTARVSAYLAALRRDLGPRRYRPTDALSKDQVQATADLANGTVGRFPIPSLVHRLRGLAAVADLCDINVLLPEGVRAIHDLPIEAFRVRGDDIVITVGGRRVLVDRAHQPGHHNAVVTALLVGAGNDYPLRPRPAQETDLRGRKLKETPGEGTEGTRVSVELRRLRAAWLRANPQDRPATSKWLPVAAYTTCWERSTPEDRSWWILHMDPRLELRVRDVAFFITGVVTGSRYADRAALRRCDLERTPTGYCYELDRHKGALISARHGNQRRPLIRRIDHLDEKDPARCPPFCPACCLDRYLDLRAREGDTDLSPLFPGRDPERGVSASGAMVLARRVISAVADMGPDDGTDRRYGTRTMRVTAATVARAMGCSYQEIAEDYTGHQSVTMVALYVRINGWEADLTLPLMDSATVPLKA